MGQRQKFVQGTVNKASNAEAIVCPRQMGQPIEPNVGVLDGVPEIISKLFQ